MSATVLPDLAALFAEFPPADDQPAYEVVPAEAVPPPYHGLLVHTHHMTVTVEKHHGDRVDVRVLARAHRPPHYARKILLATQRTGRVVQFGIVRVNLDFLPPAAREEVLSERTPFGRVLIKHHVLRRVQPTTYLRLECGPAQMRWFGLSEPRELYGRLGIIHCDGLPAVEVLEIVAPE